MNTNGGQMKLLRSFGTALLLLATLALQSCGNNNTDTSGSLTVGAATVGTASCGVQSVTDTITYSPPTLVSGAVPNGVQVVVSWYENGILVHHLTNTLSDSPTFTIGYPVVQQFNAGPTTVEIVASIGGMNSSTFAIIPAFTNNTGCSH